MSENTSAAPEAAASEPTNDVVLSLADIQNAVKVIDFAADQGAFKGWQTIEQVLVVRSRLNNFIAAAQAQQTSTDAPEASEATDAAPAEAAPPTEAQG